MNHWKVLESGIDSALNHMQMDADLLKDLENHQQPILHFYDFRTPSATYGYFVKPEQFLHLENAKKYGLEIARRPTGGGIVFHLTDFAFSVLLPRTHQGFSLNTMNNYAFINAIVKTAIIEMIGKSYDIQLLKSEIDEPVKEASYFCMAKPTKYDVIINEKKIGGAAIRLTKSGLLYQGTISLGLPEENFLKEILISKDVLNCMKNNSCLLLNQFSSPTTKLKLKSLLAEAFCCN